MALDHEVVYGVGVAVGSEPGAHVVQGVVDVEDDGGRGGLHCRLADETQTWEFV